MKAIGTFYCDKNYPYEAARQASLDAVGSEGYVSLLPGLNFEQALIGLSEFSHIWLIFSFHQNEKWKPMVLPPRGDHKVGVFASRSPYRPNGIGMSAVKLARIDGLKLYIEGHDLLNETPILDIKPYVPQADLIAAANSGWLPVDDDHSVEFSEIAAAQIAFLEKLGVGGLRPFLLQQLASEPTNSRKKRVQQLPKAWQIAYRTWRAEFRLVDDRILIERITSAYSVGDLENPEDPHKDKQIHLKFSLFSSN